MSSLTPRLNITDQGSWVFECPSCICCGGKTPYIQLYPLVIFTIKDSCPCYQSEAWLFFVSRITSQIGFPLSGVCLGCCKTWPSEVDLLLSDSDVWLWDGCASLNSSSVSTLGRFIITLLLNVCASVRCRCVNNQNVAKRVLCLQLTRNFLQ
jgi:hypothetical protein